MLGGVVGVVYVLCFVVLIFVVRGEAANGRRAWTTSGYSFSLGGSVEGVAVVFVC